MQTFGYFRTFFANEKKNPPKKSLGLVATRVGIQPPEQWLINPRSFKSRVPIIQQLGNDLCASEFLYKFSSHLLWQLAFPYRELKMILLLPARVAGSTTGFSKRVEEAYIEKETLWRKHLTRNNFRCPKSHINENSYRISFWWKMYYIIVNKQSICIQ